MRRGGRQGETPVRVVLAAVPALMLSLAFAAPAGAQGFFSSPSNEDLARRVQALQSDLDQLRGEVGLPPAASGGGGGGGGAVGVGTLRRLGEIEAELQRLTAAVEQLQFRQNQIAEDAQRRFGDIEFRLTELEGGDIAALPAAPPPLGGTPVGTPVASQGPAVSVSEQRDFDGAVSLVNRGQLDRAEGALLDFIDTYPDSPLVPEARFWIGETYFTRGEWRPAARSYLAGFNADPAGEAAADNLMKLGVSLGRLGQVSEACSALGEVGRRFPRATRAVAEAEGEANRLSCG
ncbi:MAG: tol-pal system protein YbgF [Pseudomonadota bacterium]